MRKIGTRDDGCDGRPLWVGLRGRGDVRDIFRLADGLHVLRAVGPVFGSALEKHGLHDVVAVIGVGPQLVELVGPDRPLPQMVVGIDDLAIRVDDLFAMLREPCVVVAEYGHLGSPPLSTMTDDCSVTQARWDASKRERSPAVWLEMPV